MCHPGESTLVRTFYSPPRLPLCKEARSFTARTYRTDKLFLSYQTQDLVASLTRKPSILFVGHRQTVQNMTRLCIRLSTVCKQKFLLEFEKKK